jgi:hypothetical protein
MRLELISNLPETTQAEVDFNSDLLSKTLSLLLMLHKLSGMQIIVGGKGVVHNEVPRPQP